MSARPTNKFIGRYMPIRPRQPFGRQGCRSGYHPTDPLFIADTLQCQPPDSMSEKQRIHADWTGICDFRRAFLVSNLHFLLCKLLFVLQ